MNGFEPVAQLKNSNTYDCIKFFEDNAVRKQTKPVSSQNRTCSKKRDRDWPGRSRLLASPCFTKGEVYLRAASELANTNSASKMTCRHRKKHLITQVLFSTKSADVGRNPPSVDEIASR